MTEKYTQKMKEVREKIIEEIPVFFGSKAIEAHLFGSIARGTDDAMSDIDAWITFNDVDIDNIIDDRMVIYEKFGKIVLLHEMQNNYPLNGIQTAIIYKIDDELIRVDFYLCPLSSSRVIPGSKILFEKTHVKAGDIIPETKRIKRDISDRVTFFISMCFNSIKKVVRKDDSFVDFLIDQFKKYENDIPELANIPHEASFNMLRKALDKLDTVSNPEQRNAISEIRMFMSKIESDYRL